MLKLAGKKFGKLTAIRQTGKVGSYRLWLCKCDCGNTTEVKSSNLNSGRTRSCGCLCDGNPTHGMRRSKEYSVWVGIKQRCLNPKIKSYKDYGANGVTICDEWKDSFEAFISHVGKCPSESHTIDRIDSSGNYEPGNCRWATRTEQNRNRKNTVYLDVDGEKVALPVLAEKHGLTAKTLWARLFSFGWSLDKALSHKTKERS